MVTLIVKPIKEMDFVHKETFDTITEAYNYYVRYFSTKIDWLYYLFHCHRLLNRVKDEEVMEAVFRNVFTNACIVVK